MAGRSLSSKVSSPNIKVSPIDAAALKAGENMVAVHCKQTTGGQAIDVHLIDARPDPDTPRCQSALNTRLNLNSSPNGERRSPRRTRGANTRARS